jgi:hypothetical protein
MRKYHLVVLHGVAFVALPLSGAFLVGGCSANIHDNTINIPNATINATADVDVNNVAPEQTVPIDLNVQNVYLVAPEATPPPEHMADACHVNVYMDSVSTPPILVTAEAHVDVKIPAATPPGKHKLICRLHKHGTDEPTSTKTEIQIDVKASVTIGGDAGTTPDAAGTTPDATGGTPDAGATDTGAATDAVAASI